MILNINDIEYKQKKCIIAQKHALPSKMITVGCLITLGKKTADNWEGVRVSSEGGGWVWG